MKTQRLRGLFYNTAPLGLGHLVRSINLCKGLIAEFDIDYVLGSPSPLPFPHSPHFNLMELPALSRKSNEAPLSDVQGNKSLEEILKQRKQSIDRLITEKYDFFICEHFPFGRFYLMDEILYLIKKIKTHSPECIITSSFRGAKRLNPQTTHWVDVLLHELFDYVFVHVDQTITDCEETLKPFKQFQRKFIFTGYLSDPAYKPLQTPRKKQILVSSGAGLCGKELIKTLVQTAPLIPDYKFLIVWGSKTSDAFKSEIAQICLQKEVNNIEFVPLITDFARALNESALAINLGGAGTLTDIITTQTPALVMAANTPIDQEARVELFAKHGWVRMITKQQLIPTSMQKLILSAISSPLPSYRVNMNGAKNTTAELSKILNRRTPL